MEFIWIIYRGLVRDREKRFQSVAELEMALKGVQDGNIRVQCHITLAKSYAQRFSHWVDRHPALYTSLFRLLRASIIGLAIMALVGLGLSAWWLVR
jgi:hypothetical protein